jgi:prepilin peptidase CpaA
MSLIDALILVASASAAYTDVRTHRIPNALPIALCLAGAIATFVRDWHGIIAFVTILALALGIGTVLHAQRLLGGGDVKLIAAASAAYGTHDILAFLLATTLAGGIIALVYAAIRGRLSTTLINLQSMAIPALAGVRPTLIQTGTKMPYALAIFAGAITVALMHVMH